MLRSFNLTGLTSRYSYYSEKILWPVFFIWPFLAFMMAMVNYKYRTSRIIVYLFVILYGLTFVIANTGVDSYEYSQKLLANAGRAFNDFWDSIVGKYAYDTSVDIVEPFISFMVSRVTSRHYILFGIFASILGYFSLRSFNILHSRFRENPGVSLGFFLFFFLIINPVFNINGFRFYTAAWIFFYGAFNFLLKKEKKYVIIALSSALVHFSFLTAGIVLIGYMLVGNRNYIYLPILLVSFVLPNLLMPYLNRMSLGASLQNRIEGYTNIDYIESLAESSAALNWFMRAESFVFYFVLLAIIFLKFRHKEESEKPEIANLFSFLIIFLAFVNFGKNIPSVGRFQNVFLLFAAAYIIMILVQVPVKKQYLVSLAGFFPIILMSSIVIRMGLETINFRLFEPLIFMFWGEDISLWSLLFG